jgi:hypothetical protein
VDEGGLGLSEELRAALRAWVGDYESNALGLSEDAFDEMGRHLAERVADELATPVLYATRPIGLARTELRIRWHAPSNSRGRGRRASWSRADRRRCDRETRWQALYRSGRAPAGIRTQNLLD